MKKLFVLMVLAAILLAGCNKDKVTNIDEKIIGKWITADINGQPLPTNQKMVVNFVSNTKAFVSASRNSNQETATQWLDHKEANVVIDGNKVTLTSRPDEQTTMVEEFDITAITASEFTANHKITVTENGTVVLSNEGVIRMVKVNTDDSQAILGVWECLELTGGETYNDANARLEFFADGTYNYYRKNSAGVWELILRETNNYFVDGNFLATRWKATDQPMNYEWWEISDISDDQMQWTALRQNPDGTTFRQGMKWKRVLSQTLLIRLEEEGMLYDNVTNDYTYDADQRLVNIRSMDESTGLLIAEYNITYSPGHISVNSIGGSISKECTLDDQGRIIEMLINKVQDGVTTTNTYTYTYDADGHLKTRTSVVLNSTINTTYTWDNDEMKSIESHTGSSSSNNTLTKFETSDVPAQALFNILGYDSEVYELCTQGCYGKLPKHLPSKTTMITYIMGNPFASNSNEYTYTVVNGRLATMKLGNGNSSTLHWGMQKKYQ